MDMSRPRPGILSHGRDAARSAGGPGHGGNTDSDGDRAVDRRSKFCPTGIILRQGRFVVSACCGNGSNAGSGPIEHLGEGSERLRFTEQGGALAAVSRSLGRAEWTFQSLSLALSWWATLAEYGQMRPGGHESEWNQASLDITIERCLRDCGDVADYSMDEALSIVETNRQRMRDLDANPATAVVFVVPEEAFRAYAAGCFTGIVTPWPGLEYAIVRSERSGQVARLELARWGRRFGAGHALPSWQHDTYCSADGKGVRGMVPRDIRCVRVLASCVQLDPAHMLRASLREFSQQPGWPMACAVSHQCGFPITAESPHGEPVSAERASMLADASGAGDGLSQLLAAGDALLWHDADGRRQPLLVLALRTFDMGTIYMPHFHLLLWRGDVWAMVRGPLTAFANWKPGASSPPSLAHTSGPALAPHVGMLGWRALPPEGEGTLTHLYGGVGECWLRITNGAFVRLPLRTAILSQAESVSVTCEQGLFDSVAGLRVQNPDGTRNPFEARYHFPNQKATAAFLPQMPTPPYRPLAGIPHSAGMYASGRVPAQREGEATEEEVGEPDMGQRLPPLLPDPGAAMAILQREQSHVVLCCGQDQRDSFIYRSIHVCAQNRTLSNTLTPFETLCMIDAHFTAGYGSGLSTFERGRLLAWLGTPGAQLAMRCLRVVAADTSDDVGSTDGQA